MRRQVCAGASWACGLVLVGVMAGAQTPGPTAGAVPFKAAGNEPGWTLDIGVDRITVVSDYGATRVVFPLMLPTRIEGGRRYEVRTEGHTLVATLRDVICQDTMSGMPKPVSVEMVFDGRTLKGCGGDPTSLLRGVQWTVSEINGYLALAQGRDGVIHLITSKNHYAFNLAWLKARPPAP